MKKNIFKFLLFILVLASCAEKSNSKVEMVVKNIFQNENVKEMEIVFEQNGVKTKICSVSLDSLGKLKEIGTYSNSKPRAVYVSYEEGENIYGVNTINALKMMHINNYSESHPFHCFIFNNSNEDFTSEVFTDSVGSVSMVNIIDKQKAIGQYLWGKDRKLQYAYGDSLRIENK